MWKSVHGCEFLCPFCRSVDEFLLHTLFVCKHAKEVWKFCSDWLDIKTVISCFDSYALMAAFGGVLWKQGGRLSGVLVGFFGVAGIAYIIFRGKTFQKQNIIQESHFRLGRGSKVLMHHSHIYDTLLS